MVSINPLTPSLSPVSAGYRPFDEGHNSDHRATWLDLTKQSVLGHEAPQWSLPMPANSLTLTQQSFASTTK